MFIKVYGEEKLNYLKKALPTAPQTITILYLVLSKNSIKFGHKIYNSLGFHKSITST